MVRQEREHKFALYQLGAFYVEVWYCTDGMWIYFLIASLFSSANNNKSKELGPQVIIFNFHL
jgi:hypothetical protein